MTKPKPCPVCYLPMSETKGCRVHGMPYKDRAVKNAVARIRKPAQARGRWKKMGLDILEEQKTLVCLTCRKETSFFSSNLFRHESDCPMRAVSLKLIGKTEKQTKWSRRNGHRRDT